MCSDSGMVASVWDYLMCAQILMRAIACWGCTDTTGESALKAIYYDYALCALFFSTHHCVCGCIEAVLHASPTQGFHWSP